MEVKVKFTINVDEGQGQVYCLSQTEVKLKGEARWRLFSQLRSNESQDHGQRKGKLKTKLKVRVRWK